MGRVLKYKFFAIVSVALFSLTVISCALAEEKILDFDSHIILHSDSTMTVIEQVLQVLS